MKLAIFAIALDEERYLAEWLDYHKRLGFTDFFIYDNSANNKLRDFASDSVKIIYFPGKGMQIPAYNNFLENFASDFDYAMALDLDEFLVIHNGLSITEFIQTYLTSAGVVIHWRFFGSNGHITYSNQPVLKRFIKCQDDCSDHFKTIIDCKKVVRYTNPHMPDLTVDGEIFELTGELVTGHASQINTTSIAQINHYFCKSWEEFNWKINRGRITLDVEPRSTNDFFWANRNDVVDKSALNLITNKKTTK
jgi:hypothetical protein